MSPKEKKATEDELNMSNAQAETADHQEESAENTSVEENTDKTVEEAKELTSEEKLQAQLDETEAKLADLQDKYLRQVAEFDNYRKRTMKEKAELIKNGGEKTITEILPVLDDLERALKNMQNAEDVASIREGIELISQKFMKVLQQQGLKTIDTDGQEFNTDYHEAIALVPAPNDDLKGKILDCVQTGYALNDKVIRHAKVAVAQ